MLYRSTTTPAVLTLAAFVFCAGCGSNEPEDPTPGESKPIPKQTDSSTPELTKPTVAPPPPARRIGWVCPELRPILDDLKSYGSLEASRQERVHQTIKDYTLMPTGYEITLDTPEKSGSAIVPSDRITKDHMVRGTITLPGSQSLTLPFALGVDDNFMYLAGRYFEFLSTTSMERSLPDFYGGIDDVVHGVGRAGQLEALHLSGYDSDVHFTALTESGHTMSGHYRFTLKLYTIDGVEIRPYDLPTVLLTGNPIRTALD